MKFPFALWTSLMVAELVWRQFGIRLSKASVCRLLNQLGLSPQKPLWRAFQKDPERVEKWVAVRGKTPVVCTTGARFGCNMISAITPKGAMRFMLVKGKINADVFVDFLKRLMHNWPRSVFLIIDGHPVHKSVAVSKFVASTEGRLQLFYLPPYSPELNPDEQVWNHLKNHGVGRRPVTGPDQLKQLIISHLRRVQKLPSLVRSFFNLPETVYAAVQ